MKLLFYFFIKLFYNNEMYKFTYIVLLHNKCSHADIVHNSETETQHI